MVVILELKHLLLKPSFSGNGYIGYAATLLHFDPLVHLSVSHFPDQQRKSHNLVGKGHAEVSSNRA